MSLMGEVRAVLNQLGEHDVELKEIAEAAELVLKTCKRIDELEGYIEALESANGGIKVRAIAYGFSSESYDNGRLHLDLGDAHKPWVIARLKEMVQEHKDALLKIRPFYAKDSCERSND